MLLVLFENLSLKRSGSESLTCINGVISLSETFAFRLPPSIKFPAILLFNKRGQLGVINLKHAHHSMSMTVGSFPQAGRGEPSV